MDIKKVSVIMAMNEEVEALENSLKRNGFQDLGKSSFSIRGLEVNIVKCGVLFSKKKVMEKKKDGLLNSGLVIYAGIAGGVNPQYKTGGLVMPENAVLINDGNILPDVKIAVEDRVNINNWFDSARRGTIGCSNRFVGHKTKRGLLGIDIVDMESYHVLQWCYSNGIYPVVLKCVGDSFANRLPPESALIEYIRGVKSFLLRNFFKKPIICFRLVCLMINTRKAARVLAEHITGTLTKIS